MNSKNVIRIIIALVFIIFLIVILQMYFTNRYLNSLRLAVKNKLNTNQVINENYVKIYLDRNDYQLIKQDNFIAIKIKNKSNEIIKTNIFSNYSNARNPDNYSVNYSNNRYLELLPNTSSTLYLVPYFSEWFFKNEECSKSSPVFLNFQLSNIKDLIIEDVFTVNRAQLPFLIELNDNGQKYLISNMNAFSFYIKKSYKDSKLIEIDNFKIDNNFINYSYKKNEGIYINKRHNSSDICSGKNILNFNDVSIVSICGKTFSVINSKKLNSLNFDRLEINGKLTKGNLRIILEDQYKNKITRIISQKGEYIERFIISKENIYFLNIFTEINVYDYPQTEFLLKKIKLFKNID